MNFAEGGRLFGWMQKARRESSTLSPSAIDFWHRTTYSRHTLISIRIGIAKMPDEDWIKTLEDGRKVKFVYQELPEDGALTTAQLARIFIPEFHLTVVCRPHTCRERSANSGKMTLSCSSPKTYSHGCASEPGLAEQRQQLQRERNGALLRVHAAVCFENCLTPPTLSERRFIGNRSGSETYDDGESESSSNCCYWLMVFL